MPNENTVVVADPRDAEIASLKTQVANLAADNKALTKRSADLEQRLSTTPGGDYCVLSGKTYTVTGTVPARFATDEARKGNFDLEGDLVILKRD